MLLIFVFISLLVSFAQAICASLGQWDTHIADLCSHAHNSQLILAVAVLCSVAHNIHVA